VPPEQLGIGRIVTWLRCQREPRTTTLKIFASNRSDDPAV
jgi:hypothetical protein